MQYKMDIYFHLILLGTPSNSMIKSVKNWVLGGKEFFLTGTKSVKSTLVQI